MAEMLAEWHLAYLGEIPIADRTCLIRDERANLGQNGAETTSGARQSVNFLIDRVSLTMGDITFIPCHLMTLDVCACLPCAFRQLFLLSQRSEEHTSELQSRQYLVCRLLLEKKKARDAISIFSLPGRIGITGILSSNWCRVRFCLGCTLRELDLAP